ncbi:MAG: hypothetical protein AUG91_08470 [Actinobacteria bacterium 13_1_20CM_4_69_9]|nr:MAG: hypothetical protein AUG91_08470 [Actinobacteria bacterium 13_1_20CM_4_69_9]
MHAFTVGHGIRPLDELIETLRAAAVQTLVDVRRFPGSRRNPQFNQERLREALETAGIVYRHAVELGGRRSGEPGEEEFGCIRTPAFRSYAARMRSDAWQTALATELTQPAPCFMCAETAWQRCHRRLIAELLTARGADVTHLLGPGRGDCHALYDGSEIRAGKLFLCGAFVA